MTDKHTQGPWRIGDAGHTVFGPKTDNPSPKTVAHNLSRANAHLIAAAPAMLEALENIMSEYPDMCADAGTCADPNTLGKINRARAAIESAKGDA